METKPDSTPHGAGPLAVGGVLFDIDGTLTRTNELIFATFNFIATKYCGRTYEPREIIALFGPPEEGALLPIVGKDRLGAAMDDLCEFYRGHHHAMASLHAGMDDVLAFLKTRGIPLGIFTGKGRRTAMITLEALGIEGYFDMIVSGNDVVRHKPAGATSVAVLWDSYDSARVARAGADAVFYEVSGFLQWLKTDVRYVPGGV